MHLVCLAILWKALEIVFYGIDGGSGGGGVVCYMCLVVCSVFRTNWIAVVHLHITKREKKSANTHQNANPTYLTLIHNSQRHRERSKKRVKVRERYATLWKVNDFSTFTVYSSLNPKSYSHLNIWSWHKPRTYTLIFRLRLVNAFTWNLYKIIAILSLISEDMCIVFFFSLAAVILVHTSWGKKQRILMKYKEKCERGLKSCEI